MNATRVARSGQPSSSRAHPNRRALLQYTGSSGGRITGRLHGLSRGVSTRLRRSAERVADLSAHETPPPQGDQSYAEQGKQRRLWNRPLGHRDGSRGHLAVVADFTDVQEQP